jgi:hypothetical protein
MRVLYQLEYHMKTSMKSVLVIPSVAATALLATWFTLGSQIARAEDPETSPAPAQEMILVSAKDVHALEQRVAYLEEAVTALTESWQHIDTHRLCVSDASGAQTCITKAQLDAFLSQSVRAQIGEPAVSQEAKVAPPAEPVAMVAQTLPASEPSAAPATVVGEIVLTEPDPETTGTATATPDNGEVLPLPKLEVYEEPAARSED